MNKTTLSNPQTVAGHSVEIKTNMRGLIVARIDSNKVVPLALCGLGAGRDAWMRDIQCRCLDCREVFPVSDLNEGFYCEPCATRDLD